MFYCLHIQLSTISFSIVTPDSDSTIVFNIVNNIVTPDSSQTMLLTTFNNVGSKTLFNPGPAFLLLCLTKTADIRRFTKYGLDLYQCEL